MTSGLTGRRGSTRSSSGSRCPAHSSSRTVASCGSGGASRQSGPAVLGGSVRGRVRSPGSARWAASSPLEADRPLPASSAPARSRDDRRALSLSSARWSSYLHHTGVVATFQSDSGSRPGPYAAPPAQSQARVPRGLPTPTNSHLVQPRLTNSREFSGRPTRGNSRIEGTRPVRSGLPPPPSRLPNLDREETRAGFLPSFRGFCRSRRTARRAGRAHRATLSVPVSSLDFRGERLRRRLPSGCSVYATAATHGQRLHLYRESTLWAALR